MTGGAPNEAQADVLDSLRGEPMTIADLAVDTGRGSDAIGDALSALREARLVEVAGRTRRSGRSSKLWALTAAGRVELARLDGEPVRPLVRPVVERVQQAAATAEHGFVVLSLADLRELLALAQLEVA